MALHAKEGLFLLLEVVRNRPVRFMTNGAVLRHGRMLEGEGPFLLRMTLEAELRDALSPQHGPVLRSVLVMAIRALDLALEDRMV